jgi:hypothetical protein
VPAPGEHLVIDWGEEGALKVFCAVFAWSRWRFVRFARRMDQPTTLRLLAECFELAGGVPAVVLADRMGCLKGGVVANVVVPAPAYVAFAAHYGFRPDFCEAADPESKGTVEHLVGYAKADLVVGCGPFPTPEAANEAAPGWCTEVNGRLHSEIAAVPDQRLAVERRLLRPLPSLRPLLGAVQRTAKAASQTRCGERCRLDARCCMCPDEDQLAEILGAEVVADEASSNPTVCTFDVESPLGRFSVLIRVEDTIETLQVAESEPPWVWWRLGWMDSSGHTGRS